MRLSAWTRGAARPSALVAAAVLAACGGGGSPSSDSPNIRPQAAVKGGSAEIGRQVRAAGNAGGEGLAKGSRGLYIVQLAESPVVAYDGGISGYKATRPAAGRKLDSSSPDVGAYTAYLAARHDAVMGAVGATKKVYSYATVFNGFAAELTDAQAAKLALTKGVLSVSRDERRTLDTATTPSFLGLDAPAPVGAWSRSKGEGVIIAIVDGGVWPEHPSFSDRTDVNGNGTKDGKLGYQQLPGWNGKCTPGQAFNASHCNQKLIGARWYNSAFGGDAGVAADLPWEFVSGRDYGGHGTHTATTAGGNQNVPTTGDASLFGSISGIAPRARIASYKVCWQQTPAGGSGSCGTADSVAAIDQAVSDGVDVINYSISGSRTNFLDPVEVAFLFAADAGVFVATSAGNNGPATSTVAHPSPWVTTVAAGTHNRDGAGSVTLGNGATYNGASVALPVSAPLIDATAAGLPGADPAALALCFLPADYGGPAVLDPAKVAGKIVVCDRGVNARINKSAAVKAAGGVGMLLVNTSVNSINADFHFVPTVHLQSTDRAAIKAYAAAADATASIAAGTVLTNAPAPFTAAFSSRGPLLAGAGNLLKPDLIAPGQDIAAGVAPPGNSGRLFDLYSGTSMSSPHVAGLAALFKSAYPNWSPMAIKSALMTTGSDVLDGPPTNPAVIFRQGAGHVRPNLALDPGLVFDSGFLDWLSFLCGTTSGVAPSTCSALASLGYSSDPSNFNGASIAVGGLPGAQTMTRTVRNVGQGAATYQASISAAAGIAVSVSPASFTIPAGGTQQLSITVVRTSAALNAYAGAQIALAAAGRNTVRVPVVVRPVALAAPAQVAGSYAVKFGYDGPFTATPRGLIPSVVTAGTVADDPTDSTCGLASPNAVLIPVMVPPGTVYARLSLFDADVAQGADIDLCVFNAAGTLVGTSGSGTSAEEVNLAAPAAEMHTVVVQGWGVVGTSTFKLNTWLLGGADAGNMTVSAPPAAVTGASGTITIQTSGLAPATKYLGQVVYGGTAGLPAPTVVRIDTP